MSCFPLFSLLAFAVFIDSILGSPFAYTCTAKPFQLPLWNFAIYRRGPTCINCPPCDPGYGYENEGCLIEGQKYQCLPCSEGFFQPERGAAQCQECTPSLEDELAGFDCDSITGEVRRRGKSQEIFEPQEVQKSGKGALTAWMTVAAGGCVILLLLVLGFCYRKRNSQFHPMDDPVQAV